MDATCAVFLAPSIRTHNDAVARWRDLYGSGMFRANGQSGGLIKGEPIIPIAFHRAETYLVGVMLDLLPERTRRDQMIEVWAGTRFHPGDPEPGADCDSRDRGQAASATLELP